MRSSCTSSRPASARSARAAWELRSAATGASGWTSCTPISASPPGPRSACRARVRALTVHGSDISHPRTRMLTARVIPIDLLAAASAPWRKGCPRGREPARRCCPAASISTASTAIPRAQARAELKLDPRRAVPAVPRRPGPSARSATTGAGAGARRRSRTAHAGRRSSPSCVALWINASNAVLVPSGARGLRPGRARGAGLRRARAGHARRHPPRGAARRRGDAVRAVSSSASGGTRSTPTCATRDPRIAGRAHAEPYSAPRMAERVLDGLARGAWSAPDRPPPIAALTGTPGTIPGGPE